MFEFIVRAAGMYFLALLMIRLLGKRALGELGPFDFVVMTGVGHTVVAVALDKSLPFYEGIVILFTLAFLEYIIGYLALKKQSISYLITGKPVVLIENGKIIKENLAREKFNVDDLLQELRKQGVRSINEVDKGILESCGGFTVVLKDEDEPVTRRDLGLEKRNDDSFSTAQFISRTDFFNMQSGEDIAPEARILLPELLMNIEKRLEQVCERLDEMEKGINSK